MPQRLDPIGKTPFAWTLSLCIRIQVVRRFSSLLFLWALHVDGPKSALSLTTPALGSFTVIRYF
jgi:hypothetical protein